MKKLLSIISITIIAAVLMTSCKNGLTPQPVASADTIGLAAFQNWKLQEYQQAMYANTTTNAPEAVAKTKVIYRNANTNYSSGKMNSSSTHTANTTPTSSKKKWSKAAKGAVIGGAGGAVVGAVVNKRNRVAGGVIGGILGGGIGYGIGRSKDKKDGRY